MVKKSNIKNTEQVARNTKPLISPDWTGTQGLTPFYDQERGMYVVAVSLKYETTGRNFQRAYPNEYIEAGVKQIAEYYTKLIPTDVSEIIKLGVANEYYVPPRPRAKIKVLVGIEQGVFDKMQVNNALDTTAVHEITLNTKNLTKKVDGIVNIFHNFHSNIKEYTGKVYGINMESEASDFKNIPYAIRSLVQDNGYDYNESVSNLITIGINKDNVPTYAQINKGQKYENLVNKFGAFKVHPSIKNPQSVHYLSVIDSIYGDYKSVPPITWEKFLEKYTIKDYRIDPNAEPRRYNPTPGNPEEQKTKEMDKESTLSLKELKRQKNIWGDRAFNANIAERTAKTADQVENNVLNNIKTVENSLDGLESSYYQFLHQYQVVPLVNQAIICLDPNGEVARRYREIKQFLRDSARFVEGIIDILKIPTIDIPDFDITVDIMADIGEKIFAAVWEALKSALLQLLRDILQMIVESCGNPDKMNFGGMPMKDLFTDRKVFGSLMQNVFGERALGAVLDGVESGVTNIANFDLEVSKEAVKGIQGFLGNEAVQRLLSQGVFRPGGEMDQLIAEVSAILTPGEVSKLLLQGGTPEIQDTIKTVVVGSDRYSDALKDLFSSESKVSDYFQSVGKLLDEEELLKVVADAQDVIPDRLQGLCNENPYGDLRMSLLMDKGLSADEAKKQIDDADQRKRKRLSDLAALLEKDNFLEGVLPPTFCTFDENGNIIPGLIDIDHPSFTHMLKRTVDTSYDNVHSTFNEDVLGFIPSLKQKTPDGFREVKRTIPKPNRDLIQRENVIREENGQPTLPLNIINPEFEGYVGQGYRPLIDFPYPYLTSDTPDSTARSDRDGNPLVQIGPVQSRQLSPDPDVEAQVQSTYGISSSILIPKNSQRLVPGLQENLSNLSLTGTSAAYFKYYNSMLVLEQPNQLVQSFGSYGGGANGNDFRSSFQQQMANQGYAGLGLGPDKWLINYDSLEPSSDDKEAYNFTIYSNTPSNGSNSQTHLIYHDYTEETINKQAYNVIFSQSLNPDIPSYLNKSRQERLFASLLDKSFSNGPVIRPTTDINSFYIDAEGGAGSRGILEQVLENQSSSENLSSLYVEIFRDFFTTFSSEIAESDFFKEGQLELVNLTPRLSRAQIEAGCLDPHLLNLDEIKQIVINQYKIAKCVEKNLPNEDGLGTNKNNALESAVISGATIVTIRVYAIETILKGIWAFSEFKFTRPEDIDQTLVEYIRNRMIGRSRTIGEIRKKGYADEFLLQCFRTYNRMANVNPNDELEPLQDEEAALDYLIRIELYKSMQKMDLILDNNQDNTIDSVVSDTFIPVFDVPRDIITPLVTPVGYNNSRLTTEPRISAKEIHILNELNRYEKYLRDNGLTEEAIARREEWYSESSKSTYAEIIYHLAKKDLRVNDSWGFGRAFDWTLRSHFENLPLPDSLKQPFWAYKRDLSLTNVSTNITIGGINTITASIVGGNVGSDPAQKTLQNVFTFSEVRRKSPPRYDPTSIHYQFTPSFGDYMLQSNTGRTDWPYKLENPLINDNEWESTGLTNQNLWYDGISEYEYRSALTMFEIFNCPNVLMPGNAGSSYSTPVGINYNATRGQSTYVYPMYRLVELPSAKKAYTPNSFYGPKYAWYEDSYSEPYHTDGNPRVPVDQVPAHYGHKKNMELPYHRMPRKTWTYRLIEQDTLPEAKNFNFPQPEYLAEDMFHPKMMQYNMQEATIPSMPEDIQMEIEYYDKWNVWNDEELYLNIKRQFWSNKHHWALSYSERKRLDKIGKDFLNSKWNDRPLPTVANLQSSIQKHHQRLGKVWKPATLTFILDQLKNRIENLQNPNPNYIPRLYDTYRAYQPARTPYRTTIGNWTTEPDGWSRRPTFQRGHPVLSQQSHEYGLHSAGGRTGVSDNIVRDFMRSNNKTFREVFDEMLSLRDNNGAQAHYGPRYTDGNTTFSTSDYSRMGTPEIVYLYAYHLMWEIDWWMSKLAAFYLLSPDFRDYREIKDYTDFLGKIKDAAQYVKDESAKDLDGRKRKRQEVLDEMGRLRKMREPKGSPLTWFMDNGNVIYEKYIKVTHKSRENLRRDLQEIDSSGNLYNRVSVILDNMTTSETGVVNVDKFAEWLTSNFGPSDEQLVNVDINIPGNPRLVQAVMTEAECGENLVFITPQTEATVMSQVIKISDLFENLSVGLRMTCVASPSEDSPLLNKVRAKSRDINVAKGIKRDKAYLMNEVGTVTEYDANTNQETIRTIDKSYVTVPVVAVEEPIGADTNLAELVGVGLNAIEEEKYKLRMYHDRKVNQVLIDSLTSTDEFKLFFKYLFPVDRMFAQNIMFIETFLASHGDVTRTFNNTKESLRIIFDAMLNSGNYQYADPLTNKVLATSDFNDTYGDNKTPGVDLWSLAIKFPPMILKGLIETFDPNIAISKQIQFAANAGIRAANNLIGEGENALEDAGMLDECEKTIRIPDLPVLPISMAIFGATWIPPTFPLGWVYDFSLGIYDWIENQGNGDVAESRRCAQKEAGGRDYTKAEDCNLEPIDTSAYVENVDTEEEE